MHKIAVIIPFFQRETGLLRHAIQGVLNQIIPNENSLHIFLIDDSSPVSPHFDLDCLEFLDNQSLSIHRQDNGGPGAARNFGIELALRESYQWIAFLDSDDVWLPSHLSEALSSLDKGYDLYFCDNLREGSHDSYHEQVPILRKRGQDIQYKSDNIDFTREILFFGPLALASESISNYICQTSTVVIRANSLGDIRFDASQRTAGEDHLFWINIILTGAKVAISWSCNVICGSGLNLYFSAFDWNSNKTIDRVGYLLLMNYKLKITPLAYKYAKKDIDRNIINYKTGYGFLFFRKILKIKSPPFNAFWQLQKFDNFLFLKIPFYFARRYFLLNSSDLKW